MKAIEAVADSLEAGTGGCRHRPYTSERIRAPPDSVPGSPARRRPATRPRSGGRIASATDHVIADRPERAILIIADRAAAVVRVNPEPAGRYIPLIAEHRGETREGRLTRLSAAGPRTRPRVPPRRVQGTHRDVGPTPPSKSISMHPAERADRSRALVQMTAREARRLPPRPDLGRDPASRPRRGRRPTRRRARGHRRQRAGAPRPGPRRSDPGGACRPRRRGRPCRCVSPRPGETLARTGHFEHLMIL